MPRAGLTRDDAGRAAASLAGEIGCPAVTIELLAERSASAPLSLYKQPRGEGSEFNAHRRSSPMGEIWRIGFTARPAVVDRGLSMEPLPRRIRGSPGRAWRLARCRLRAEKQSR